MVVRLKYREAITSLVMALESQVSEFQILL